jgi:ATP:corrinoid adenosyltransferase
MMNENKNKKTSQEKINKKSKTELVMTAVQVFSGLGLGASTAILGYNAPKVVSNYQGVQAQKELTTQAETKVADFQTKYGKEIQRIDKAINKNKASIQDKETKLDQQLLEDDLSKEKTSLDVQRIDLDKSIEDATPAGAGIVISGITGLATSLAKERREEKNKRLNGEM